MAKIIIPGGHGYLGTAIGQVLAARGDEVVILSRRKSLDDDGKTIVKLDTPPNIEYPVFGAYFLVPRKGISITNTFPSRVD